MNNARYHYRTWKKDSTHACPTYFALFNKYGVTTCYITLLKKYEVVDKKQIPLYCQLWIKKLNSINKVEPGSFLLKTRRQRRYVAEYVSRNPEYHTKYYSKNCEIIKQKRAEYVAKNRDTILAKARASYQKHKNKRLENAESDRYHYHMKVKCECGQIVNSAYLKDHRLRPTHLNRMLDLSDFEVILVRRP
jgi:hypothetical protein